MSVHRPATIGDAWVTTPAPQTAKPEFSSLYDHGYADGKGGGARSPEYPVGYSDEYDKGWEDGRGDAI